jgi:hypothetical protein
MVNQKQKNTKRPYFLTLLLFLPIFFILELISLYTPIVRGFAAFPLKTIECGHQPYVANRLAGSNSYTKPGDDLYHGPDIFTKPRDYYCTEAEVQKGGSTPYLWADQCESSRQTQPAQCSYDSSSIDATVSFFTILVVISGLLSYVISLQIVKQKKTTSKKS